jgi:hypothetical protein
MREVSPLPCRTITGLFPVRSITDVGSTPQ